MADATLHDALEAPAAASYFTRRRLLVVAASAVVLLASGVAVAHALGDLPEVWRRLREGDPAWLALALAFEVLSFLGYAVLFQAVAVRRDSRIGLGASAEIALAGHAATRLFAAAGAGGVALTAWALRRSGMTRTEVAERMVTFIVLLYGVYMAALALGGAGLATGLLPGGGPDAVTLAPALLGAVTIAVVLASQRLRPGAGRIRAVLLPVGAGVRDARTLLASGNPAVLGAIGWWAANIAVLWASFSAFGEAPPVGVLVVGFFVGMLANTLPLPGGVGGVDGGMVGAFVAFGVNPALALVAVLAYRGFAFWLPIAPGAVAYVRLRRTVAGWAAEDSASAVSVARPERRLTPCPEPALAA
jgi:uncharacterized membrane protein YbhN (UPF0104 family)